MTLASGGAEVERSVLIALARPCKRSCCILETIDIGVAGKVPTGGYHSNPEADIMKIS